jgi:hypothetical protein
LLKSWRILAPGCGSSSRRRPPTNMSQGGGVHIMRKSHDSYHKLSIISRTETGSSAKGRKYFAQRGEQTNRLHPDVRALKSIVPLRRPQVNRAPGDAPAEVAVWAIPRISDRARSEQLRSETEAEGRGRQISFNALTTANPLEPSFNHKILCSV